MDWEVYRVVLIVPWFFSTFSLKKKKATTCGVISHSEIHI